MHDDALKQLWKGQPLEDRPALPDQAILAALGKRMKRFDRTILWRDFREVAACLFIVVFFGWELIAMKSSRLTQIGSVVLIVSSVFIAWKLIQSKRRLPKAEPNGPIFEVVKIELQKVENQISLLRSVAWWYLLPLFIGVMLNAWGGGAGIVFKLTYSAEVIALYTFIYWLNQRAVAKSLLPLKRELQSSLTTQETAPEEEPKCRNTMTRLMLIGFVLLSLGTFAFVRGSSKASPISYPDPESQMLESIREQQNLPALAAAVVVDGKLVMSSAVGLRKSGSPEQVTEEDQFHLGSVTKSMTATVAAMLVEQGTLSWSTSIEKSFPELGAQIHPDYRGATLEQLLSQRGGAPGQAPGDLWRQAWTAKGTAAEQRFAFVKGLLALKPEAKPGSQHIYSNQGYAIAGVMLERASGKSWEELLRTRLFEPLGMSTAGFGAPASPGKTDQPWGHKSNSLLGNVPVPPGPFADNPLAISPANAVHCSIGDLAKYAAFHMAGERGESELLRADSFKKLHTAIPGNNDYALGWKVLDRPWANGRALMHNGSNTMFYVVIWMAPEKNSALVVASNTGADAAAKGADAAASKLIEQYFGK